MKTLNYKTELPNNVKKEFGKNIFSLQFDKYITEIIKESLIYADKTMKKMSAAKVNESYILTEEAVRISKDLSQEASESIVRILQDDAIYYEHPKQLSKRIVDLWGGEKYRAERFARTFTADVATATTVARYRQYGVRYMEFDAELDDRTTNQCRCLNGTLFDLTKDSVDRYRPPLHQHCLTAGSKVQTFHTEKNIEDLQIGDMVLTHTGQYRPVTATMSRIPEEIIEISTDKRTIRITPNHPILCMSTTEGKSWRMAGDLCVGDVLISLDGYEATQRILSVPVEPVYNISVSEDESYIANGIVVHNCRSGLVPLTDDEYQPDMEFENRNFDNVLDNPDDVTRVFKNIDTFNDKYRVSKFTLDQDLGARIMFDKGFSVGISGPDLEIILKQAPTKTGTGLVDVKGNPVTSIQDVFDSIDKKSPTIEIPFETRQLLSNGNLIPYQNKIINIVDIKGNSVTGGYIKLDGGEQLYVEWSQVMKITRDVRKDIENAAKRNQKQISEWLVKERNGNFVLVRG